MATIDYKQKIKDYMNSSEVDTLYKSMLNNLFPELAESEDKRMIKFIKQQLFNIKKTITENYELDAKLTKAIDWLEKQGEEKISDKTESMKHGYIATNPEFFQWIYDRLKYVYNENPNVDYMLSLKERIEDMQKPTDNVEPKFKVGDWVDVRNNAAPNTSHLERITPSHFLRDEHWYGIELVPEILEKNEFVANTHVYPYPYYEYTNKEDKLKIGFAFPQGNRTSYKEPWVYIDSENVFIEHLPCVFVHQLQQILRFCGIDKTIEL